MKAAFSAFMHIVGFAILLGVAALMIYGASHPDPKVRDAAMDAALNMP